MFLSLTILLFKITEAQQTICGRILDIHTKQPLPGANIFLHSNWSTGTSSDKNGNFCITLSNNLRSDTLIISYIGYREVKLTTTLLGKKEATIFLQPNTHTMDASVITARRLIAEEFTVKQMKQMDVYLNPGGKADPLLTINTLPVSTTLDESATISLRGSRPDETGIFFNDVPVYDAVQFAQLNGIGTFSIFNTSIIERMHIFAGNPPIEYGNSASGIVTMQSKNTTEPKPNSILLSLAGLGVEFSKKIKKKTNVSLVGNYQPSEIFTGINKAALQNLKDFAAYNLGIHAVHHIKPKQRFKIFNYSIIEGYRYKSKTPSYTGVFNMNKKRNFTIANYIAQQKNAEVTINSGFNISNEEYKFSLTDIYIKKQDLYFSSAYQHFFEKWSIKGGGAVEYRINQSKGTKPMYYYAQNIFHPAISFSASKEYTLPSLFIYTKYNLTEKFIIGSGVRKNLVTNNIPDYWSYQLNLHYKLQKKHQFNLAAGHYNRISMPNAEQYSITHFKSKQLSLDYRLNYLENEIQISIFSKEINHSSFTDYITGAELYTRINIKPLELRFSITSIDARITNKEETYPSKYDLDYFIRSIVKYKIKRIAEISAIYVFRQGTYYLPVESSIYDITTDTYIPQYPTRENATRLPDYHKIDLSVSKYWVINQNLAVILFANVNNILNISNIMNKNYSFDYSTSHNKLYSKRTYYLGVNFIL